jgi:comEA protein
MRRVSLVTALVIAIVLAAQSSAWAQARDRAAKPKAAPASLAPVNLNTATVAELQALPGVGASTAKLIIDHRAKNGGFKKVEELMNIKGIGEKSFLKLKPLVTVGPEKAERQDAAGK